MDTQDALIKNKLTPEERLDLKVRKNLVLKRSHLNNTLDKYNSNIWNNYNRMDKKHIDQTFTSRVIKAEEEAINRIGAKIESEKLDQYHRTQLSLDIAADYIAKEFGTNSYYNKTNGLTHNNSLAHDNSDVSQINHLSSG